MKVELTQTYEDDRVKRRITWEVDKTTSMVEAVRKARDMGWKDKLVQIRKEGDTFYIEPFEKDCNCPNILKYGDFFE